MKNLIKVYIIIKGMDWEDLKKRIKELRMKEEDEGEGWEEGEEDWDLEENWDLDEEGEEEW
ncbi:MAG: hypothetical protein RXO36_00795 [Candidatus Nanopusillus acidilobi]|jgi:hypothetical protein